MEPGGFESQPQERQAMQLDNARTTPLLVSGPGPEVTCDMLGQFDKPVLVVHGGDSNAFWVQIAEGVAARLPRAEIAVLPGVNHDGPVRDPAGLAVIIEEFVARH
jgi:pimeloyl-ACP methyl ester carboxylesterase